MTCKLVDLGIVRTMRMIMENEGKRVSIFDVVIVIVVVVVVHWRSYSTNSGGNTHKGNSQRI